MNNIQRGCNWVMKPEVCRDEYGAELCFLCGRNSDLQASHIIPKFVGKWIKDTSATGFLARAIDAKRVQDLYTQHMLCSDCEQRFSRLEKLFADKIFHPFHKNAGSRLEYDSWLESFAVSLSWRILRVGYEKFKSEHPAFDSQIQMAETIWREFLLGDRHTVYPYESHLFFLDSIEIIANVPENFSMYSRRATDCTIVASNSRVFTYAKLADMVFVTSIQPKVLRGWKRTRINGRGIITSPHIIKDGVFGEFLLDRVEKIFASTTRPSPEVQQKRMQKALKDDPEKFLKSDSAQIWTDEMVLCYKRKMAGMPLLVTRLVDVICNQVAGTEAETVTNIWRSRKILDALVDLSADEAIKLGSGIQNAIDQLHATGRRTRYHLTANSIRITFIANHNSTKADQQAAIVKELTEFEAERISNDALIAIFSQNYGANGVSFEYAFRIPSDSARNHQSY
ncbi:MAG: hypothetical protein OXI27_06175 [Thaumarchaeota archaeon]|nr:hypothetical protein [Nitrososphaerota archaeon]